MTIHKSIILKLQH